MMKNKENLNIQVDAIMALLETIETDKVPPYLANRIRMHIDGIDQKKSSSLSSRFLKPALVTGFIVLNGLLCFFALHKTEKEAKIRAFYMDQLTSEYALTISEEAIQFSK